MRASQLAMQAIAANDDVILTWLLTEQKLCPNTQNEQGQSLLCQAVKSGHKQCVRALICHGAAYCHEANEACERGLNPDIALLLKAVKNAS